MLCFRALEVPRSAPSFQQSRRARSDDYHIGHPASAGHLDRVGALRRDVPRPSALCAPFVARRGGDERRDRRGSRRSSVLARTGRARTHCEHARCRRTSYVRADRACRIFDGYARSYATRWPLGGRRAKPLRRMRGNRLWLRDHRHFRSRPRAHESNLEYFRGLPRRHDVAYHGPGASPSSFGLNSK